MSEICQICNLGIESTTTNFCTTNECFHNFHTNCLLLYSAQSTNHSVQCPFPGCNKLIYEDDTEEYYEPSQNISNSDKHKNNKSGYKGVIRVVGSNGYRAQISVNGKSIYLGYALNPKDTAKMYDEAAIKYHGEFARLNFGEV